jgi:Asp-tRNA(Asn)/Glu-tRNA(Gln) amidotransferase A subunit family amidase
MKLFLDDHQTITGTARRLRAGETSCVEVLQSCLDQIDQKESLVRAWVLVDRDGALAQAAQLDAELKSGLDRGLLHGIPIGVKDIIHVSGMPTSCGMPGWEWTAPPDDAAIVARLRRAGAIILGKTVSTPFAWIDPPGTRNPWNLKRTPGGSSSGSAAAVACGMCLGALGTQTGGSITRPSAFCGVAGMKPTFGSLDTQGIFPLAPSLDHPGFIARSVADLRQMFEVCRRPDLPPEPYASWARGAVERPSLYRPHWLFDRLATPEMAAAFSSALGFLGDAGAEVSEVGEVRQAESSLVEPLLHDYRVILASEAAFAHNKLGDAKPLFYPPRFAELLQEGNVISYVDHEQACEHRATYRAFIDALLEFFDALVTPAALGPAPDPSTTGDPVFNSPWSLLGLPTVSFPIGLSVDGLPLAVQFVGRAGSDLHLLRTAKWCETVIRSANRGS